MNGLALFTIFFHVLRAFKDIKHRISTRGFVQTVEYTEIYETTHSISKTLIRYFLR